MANSLQRLRIHYAVVFDSIKSNPKKRNKSQYFLGAILIGKIIDRYHILWAKHTKWKKNMVTSDAFECCWVIMMYGVSAVRDRLNTNLGRCVRLAKSDSASWIPNPTVPLVYLFLNNANIHSKTEWIQIHDRAVTILSPVSNLTTIKV